MTNSNSSESKDYFALVENSSKTANKLQPSEIEDSLSAVANNLSQYVSERKRYTSVILERFVYTDTDRCSPKACFLALDILKAFGRLVDHSSDELVTKKAIGGLLQLALSLTKEANGDTKQSDALNACNEALTCVANAMLLQPASREYVGKCQGFETLSEILGSLTDKSSTLAFLCGRCLLLSLVSEDVAVYCVNELGLQSVIARAVSMFLDQDQGSTAAPERFTPHQVIAELFKAAMSLCVYFQRGVGSNRGSILSSARDDSLPPEYAVDFADILTAILKSLRVLGLSSGHLADPTKQAVSIALNFPTLKPDAIRDIWFPQDDRWINMDCIFELFKSIIDHIFSKETTTSATANKATAKSNNTLLSVSESYQNELTPLTLVLVRLMSENPDARLRIFHQIYPPNVEVDYKLLPEDRPGIASQIVRLMRVPQGGMLPGAMGDFLLTVLGQDIKQFIMAVGYGNAAGYMLARGIEMPEDVLDNAKGMVGENSSVVDPVTGRNLNQADINKELNSMTEEEKEREAERLFVLFERLNRTGIIKTENPVRAAMQSGRFKEIPDSLSGDESD
ncbi:hypothetical protein EV175_005969 [Coemansia sp. RSA 1933]|nr:hypothetical protein EV175_005969 [Coemansia sp. RSA 1933]